MEISVKEREVVLKPVEDPLKSLEELVVKGTRNVEKEIRKMRKAAERELQKEA
ncbi:hypothetical protein KEJ50_04890 [Candidatus Bathyarchaeota archaeon]|nr:hypothetical protein [Candidatus Bathyarchaeota archaeon]